MSNKKKTARSTRTAKSGKARSSGVKSKSQARREAIQSGDQKATANREYQFRTSLAENMRAARIELRAAERNISPFLDMPGVREMSDKLRGMQKEIGMALKTAGVPNPFQDR